MQKSVNLPSTSFSTLMAIAALSAALLISGCAGGLATKSASTVAVTPSDRLYLTVAPFDPVVAAELTRSGLEPARVAAEFESELRYQLVLRRQEESLDSSGAAVRLRVEVRHLQPGSGNAGNFAVVRLIAMRGDDSTVAEWEWKPSARKNVPEAHVVRHLARELSQETVAHLKSGTRKNFSPGLETPPPLILLK
jgi:hypothetical protein